MKTLSYVLLFFVMTSTVACGQKVNVLDTKQTQELLKKNTSIVVIDARTTEEYKAGHLPKALNIDFYSPDIENQIAKMDKSKTYLVYCRTHNRSGKFIEIMKTKGFTTIYQLYDGFPTWESNKMPVEK